MKKYKNDTRYEKVYEQMQLLGIQDVTTERQHKNGTIVWRLPIKNNYYRSKPSYIEVASFSTGYVRNQNSGYSNYQLNKRCEGEPEYFDSGRKDSMGRPLYTQFSTRSCILIPIEIDRLEYLISYCVKNYYIKNANQVPDGKFVPEWMYENKFCECDRNDEIEDLKLELSDARNDLKDRINTIKCIDVKQEQLINKIERIKTFLKHELL